MQHNLAHPYCSMYPGAIVPPTPTPGYATEQELIINQKILCRNSDCQ